MKLNVFSILRLLTLGATLSFGLAGCGGAGGSTGGGGGGGGNSFAVSFSYSGFGGECVSSAVASSTPQDVQVRVNGVVRTVQDAIVPEDILTNNRVTVLNKGTRLLNATVNDPSIGLIFGNSTVHPPVSADGILLADVVTRNSVLFRTPPLTWQGRSLPNGLMVLFSASQDDGDVSASVNANVTMPDSPSGVPRSGNTTLTYSSPHNFNSVKFAMETVNFSRIDINDTGHINGLAAPAGGTLTVPWNCTRLSGALDSWPQAGIIIDFRN